MPHLVSERTGEVVTVPSGESVVGRGPLLKVILVVKLSIIYPL